MTPARKVWKQRNEQDKKGVWQKAQAIQQELGLSEQLSVLCVLRGADTPSDADTYLKPGLSGLPDPNLMKGMPEAAARICQAIKNKERVESHCDYDVDGQVSAAILTEFLIKHNVPATYFVPDRRVDGYGLSAAAIQRAAEAGVSLIITADCGISNKDEARLAKDLGIDLIITDHHLPPEDLPDALAIVNPHQEDCSFPEEHSDLCGAGVAFYLVMAVRQALRQEGFYGHSVSEPDIRDLLDLVAMATVADIVPLKGANRLLTRAGLAIIDRRGRPGVRTLMQIARVKKASAGAIGFQLGPRINACGRIGDAADGVNLLLARTDQEAAPIAANLNNLNLERKEIEERILEDALKMIERQGGDRDSIVLASSGWDAGVIGICASRLVEYFHRPTVLIAIDENGIGKGSGRSISGYHLQQGFTRCAEYLSGFGGHEMAAGLSIPEAQIDDFCQAFEEDVQVTLPDDKKNPVAQFDMIRSLSDYDIASIEELSLLEPYGLGNPSPVFCSLSVTPLQARVVGGSHLSFIAEQGGARLKCIAFGMGDRIHEVQDGENIDILYKVSLNEWNGEINPQAEVRDFRFSRS